MGSYRPHRVPFNGTPPAVNPGDQVWCRDAYGTWHERTAHSAPRYDDEHAVKSTCYLTVAVSWGEQIINWPAEDVALERP